MALSSIPPMQNIKFSFIGRKTLKIRAAENEKHKLVDAEILNSMTPQAQSNKKVNEKQL